MAQRLLDLFRSSGDAHLGQTLVRLAKLAESAHRTQAGGHPADARALAAADLAAGTPAAAPAEARR